MRALLPILIFVLIALPSCTNIFYQPTKQQVMIPSEIGIAYEDVWIEDPAEPKLHAWYLPVKDSIATVLHLHGNAENISTHLASVYWMPAKGLSVLSLDYRGYGLSEGEVSIEGIHKDIERATRYLENRNEIDKNKLILFGQSLGGSMALYSAAQSGMHQKFQLVVAESAFSGYRNIAREKLASTWLTYPFQFILPFLVTDKYSPIMFIKDIAPSPVLLIHGTSDQIVNFKNSEELCEQLNEKCMFWRLSGGSHISAFRDQNRQVELITLIKSLL